MMTTFANRYEIQSELGQGSFGVVYRAHDMTLDRDVALKVLHPALTMDAATVRLFTREAGTLAKLDHDNIVPVYDMGVSDGARYIVMRHVPGRSLAQVLAGTAGPIVAATDYVRAVPETVRAWVPPGRAYATLGTDGFGRSDTRSALRGFFNVDAASIAERARSLIQAG